MTCEYTFSLISGTSKIFTCIITSLTEELGTLLLTLQLPEYAAQRTFLFALNEEIMTFLCAPVGELQ